MNLNFLQAQQNLENIRLSISKLEDEAMILNKNKKNIDLNFIKDKVNHSSQTLLSFEQLRKSVIQWEQNYLITSSIDGTVSFQNFIETNQYIASGDVVLSIIPNEKKGLVGIMNIPSANSGKIQKNSKVLIKLDNYRYQEFGIIEGKVEYISLTPSKEGNYYVYITLPKGLKTSYGKDIIFNKEMTGRADIITEDMRLIERFFYQIRKLLGYQL